MQDDTPKPVEAQPVTAIQTVDVRDASAQGLALMKQRVENQKEMLRIAIRLTAPNQWVVFAGEDKQTGELKESIYPTGGAADTILRRAFGLGWGEKTITIEDTDDGKVATCTAWLLNGAGDKIEEFTGYRHIKGFIKNEADLRKGALENMKSVAVRDLLGLRFRTPAELKDMGLDVGRLERRAEFQSHEKQTSEVLVPFGKSKGKPITEITDDDLQWLADAVKKSVEDPDKAKWRSKNEALLQHLRDEYKRRHQPKEEKPAERPAEQSASPAPSEEPPPEEDYSNVGPPPMGEDPTQGKEEPGL